MTQTKQMSARLEIGSSVSTKEKGDLKMEKGKTRKRDESMRYENGYNGKIPTFGVAETRSEASPPSWNRI
jgi:hypothetical protein